MKFPECEDCYFYQTEPAVCDECDDADQFEPNDEFEDSADTERKREAKVIYLGVIGDLMKEAA